MQQTVSDSKLIAACGLYCGSCKKFLKNKCPGCAKNEKASWCAIRSCCIEKDISTCAECTDFPDPMECKKYNNFMSRLFSFIFKADRHTCIQFIKDNGMTNFANMMTDKGWVSFPRK